MFVQLLKELPGNTIGERIDVADADAEQLIRQGWAKAIDAAVLPPTITRALQTGIDGAVDRALQNFLRTQPAEGKRLPFRGLGDSALDDRRAGLKHFGEFRTAA